MVGIAGVEVTLVFASGARIGPEAANLLARIRLTGSISAAAQDLGMPYKKAWMLLQSINKAFAERVITATTGGTRGGGAVLTPSGLELLERYERLAKKADELAADEIRALGHRARPRGVQVSIAAKSRKARTAGAGRSA